MSDDDVPSTAPTPWSPPLPWQREWLVERLAGRERRHHALLITGPAGMGKRILALNYAQALLCETPRPDGLACGTCAGCTYVAARTHPDLQVLDLHEFKDDEWKAVNEISVDRRFISPAQRFLDLLRAGLLHGWILRNFQWNPVAQDHVSDLRAGEGIELSAICRLRFVERE